MELKRGVVRAYDGGTVTATVQIDGSPSYLASVPVSRAIPGAEIVAGRVCAVVFFDGTNVEDGMVLGVY